MKALIMARSKSGSPLKITESRRISYNKSESKHDKCAEGVFGNVWREFYEYDEIYSKDTIASLSRDYPVGYSLPFNYAGNPTTELNDSLGSYVFGNGNPLQLDVIDFASTGGHLAAERTEKWSISLPEVTYTAGVDFVSPYQACTPTNCNIYTPEEDELRFIGLQDETGFDVELFQEKFTSFEWQIQSHTHKNDPDYSSILMETVRRLYFQHGLELDEIEKTAMFRRLGNGPLQSTTYNFGLLWEASQKDPFRWKGSTEAYYYLLPDLPLLPTDGLCERITQQLKAFCPNLNCLQANCSVHQQWMLAMGSLKFPLDPSQTTSTFLPDSENNEKCGEQCYLCEDHRMQSDDPLVKWNQKDISDLATILTIDPQASCCDLAVLCRKPCMEVFHHIQTLPLPLPEESIQSSDSSSRKRLVRTKYVDNDPQSFSPPGPCQHPGPCTTSSCWCFQNMVHCGRNCGCVHAHENCSRQRKGCSCHSTSSRSKRKCVEDSCQCIKAGRECHPELCKPCFSESINCRNIQLQQSVVKHTVVKPSQYGLGLFLLEKVYGNELICEYIGELVKEEYLVERDIINKHTGRNYIYGLNKLYCIDSARSGNPSRFINHAPGDQANCSVKILLVNEDHRIGVYTRRTLRAGTELTLDYGDQFFQNLDQDVSNHGFRKVAISPISMAKKQGRIPLNRSSTSVTDADSSDYT
ncbi:hypothetical protein C8Q75DRAFT_781265 [Abortiporus biennis]|nr:hypothetical protein C8Q75DRAFT_781265 [Abortiporus biennis]